MKLGLIYRVKRIFFGEEGIVENVLPPFKKDNLEALSYKPNCHFFYQDSDGNLPQRLLVRNPLGEIITLPASLKQVEKISHPSGISYKYNIYNYYLPGDSYP